ncbi:hypothetical protein [Stenotrophomonas maltophilia]|uniref:hypothetical protein n=1 Tax=Stenotrophomonas maltophilia TaxID=40324 RepID=UPI003BF8D039
MAINLKQIDTSTTAGKLRVMELACKGRQVAAARRGRHQIFEVVTAPNWNWEVCDFAIIAEPVGPEEVFVTVCEGDPVDVYKSETTAACSHSWEIVRYVRADLAGEKG